MGGLWIVPGAFPRSLEHSGQFLEKSSPKSSCAKLGGPIATMVAKSWHMSTAGAPVAVSGSLWTVSGSLWTVPGSLWTHSGSLWTHSGQLLGVSRQVLGVSGQILGASSHKRLPKRSARKK